MKAKDLLLILSVLIFIWICSYFGMPVLSFGFIGWPVILLFIGVIFFFFDLEDSELAGSWRMISGIIMMIAGFFFFAILPIFSSPMFRSQAYKQLIGTVEEKTFSNDISPIDPSKMVLIDDSVADRLGEKKLVSDDAALGSVVDVKKYTHQKVGNDLYYIAPLEHSGFWKWSKMREGTPGYIIVNAHNQKDVRLVKEVNGKPIHLKYQMGGCFSDYLPRHIYKNGYKSIGQFEYEFELDDQGNPFYIVPLFTKKVGYGGKDIVKILVVDPQTGKIDEYTPQTLPNWVDRAFPGEIINKQFNLWGKWVHGWPNWAHKDQIQLSQGAQLVYGDDGLCYLFSGVTSVGSDDASIGFILTNSRTKKVTYYHSGGAIESAAQASAQGKVQEKEYTASWPRPYNINGVWTYVMALKDREGLIKSIALVSYTNYETVGIGENIMDAIRNYKAALNNKGDLAVPLDDNSRSSLVGKVSRLGMDTKEGQFYYYFIFDMKPKSLFISTSALSNEVPVTKQGDRIKITYTAGNEGEIFIETFDNLDLDFTKTPEQAKADSAADIVQERINKETVDSRIKSKLENMSEEEKIKLLGEE